MTEHNTAPPRPVLEDVSPVVDGGRFAAKREQGGVVVVEADAYADGHDQIWCELRWRGARGGRWSRTTMEPVGNDRWRGTFPVTDLGRYSFAVRAGMDEVRTWWHAADAKWRAGQDVSVELEVGAELLAARATTATARDCRRLSELAELLDTARRRPQAVEAALAEVGCPETAALAWRSTPPDAPVASAGPFPVECERRRARCGAWYELFPRSTADDAGRHGTFKDAMARLDYVAAMGFDVVYLPPIHPIGAVNRKGRDGSPVAGPHDPGSPWAIGSEDGGHDAVHPELGAVQDFDALREAAEDMGLEVALDIAFQCAPDHPWVRDHPDWFRHLPDGTIRFAENPPKRYEDIYPLDFETADWRALWEALAGVVRFWIGHGVRIFRVDNPHTKPLRFWEWLISTIRAEQPEVVFLAEAFTRPKLMYHLAKAGFSQSYTYFTWRTVKWEIEQYFTELHRPPVSDFFRPNLWPNTPDILATSLQTGKRPSFEARLVLAATLSASYGIYGPAFELMESTPREPGSEEYRGSEKYEIRHWDLSDPRSLAPFVAAVNHCRRALPPLWGHGNLRFHPVDNDQLIAYTRHDPGGEDRPPQTVLVVVNLDPDFPQSGWLDLDLHAVDLQGDRPFAVHDLLGDASYRWQGRRNFVALESKRAQAHIFLVDRGEPDAPEGARRP